MPTKLFLKCILLFIILTTIACAGLRYSDIDPAAKDFHPPRIAIFPVIEVSTYEEARGNVEQIVAEVLVEKKWFVEVTDTASLNRQIKVSEELSKAMADYLSKLRLLSFSDPDLSRKIGEMTKVDAFVLLYVDSWNYTVENKDKVAKVGIRMKVVEASTGRIMWNAGHHIAETYTLGLIKPALPKVARDVARKMIVEMPH